MVIGSLVAWSTRPVPLPLDVTCEKMQDAKGSIGINLLIMI